jgi:hypothetical protein
MIKPFKTIAFSLVIGSIGVIAIAAAPACSSGGCGASSKCSADPKPTQDSIDECNKLSAGACGSQYSDLDSCAQGQQACSSDNTTDTNTTSANIAANCGTQLTAYTNCCTANTSACQ